MSPSKFAIRLCDVKRKDGQEPVQVEDVLEVGRRITGMDKRESNKLMVTLSRQGTDNVVATISCNEKKRVKEAFSRLNNDSLPIMWENIDEDFLDMTVLQDPENADLDICAIHGLNGNAFDTWFYRDNGVMWLRDLLPRVGSFRKSRIMIFGYSSELCGENKANDKDFADSLIQQLKLTRYRPQDQSRPLIIIAHSMGGLVSRLAMSRLQGLPQKFSPIPMDLSQCGLLFLSTPHYGSQLADWNRFWLRLGKMTLGIRKEILDCLKTFNLSIVDVMETWNEMPKKPVVRCLCEADKTTVNHLKYGVEVASPPSAGFLDQVAQKVLQTDHHTICKFKGISETSFGVVKENLDYIKRELDRRRMEDPSIGKDTYIARQIGDVPLEPRRTPLSPTKKYFYLSGQGSRDPGQLVGHSKVIKTIADALEEPSETMHRRRFACLSGVGGSGKTEITYEIARKLKSHRNVFMLNASDSKQLQDSYTDLSFIIGHDSLTHRYSRYQEAHKIWESLDRISRIEAIKQWFDCEENADSVMIFDDIDGLGDLNVIQQSLPSMSKSLVFSTRNPVLPETPELKALTIPVLRLTLQESEMLLRRELGEGCDITDEQVYRIIAIACHHPLTMLVLAHLIRHKPKFIYTAMGYQTVAGGLISQLNNYEWETRREVLSLKFPGPLSLLQLYERSLDRLPPDVQPDIAQLITAMAFISPPLGSPCQVSVIQFFLEHRWLDKQSDFDDFPNYKILSSSLPKISRLFSGLKNVSLLDDGPSNDGSFVHPIWLECSRHRCGKAVRISWLRQLLLISFIISSKKEVDPTWKLYRENIRIHVRVSGFSFADMDLDPVVEKWYRRLDR
ncbi:hypothetical protein F4806DRAFT_500613 [Annulohypoxylon nitens]|nr:hypothetical protein F4806DRAFT_500613 [Annulohypoxylon nitens]